MLILTRNCVRLYNQIIEVFQIIKVSDLVYFKRPRLYTLLPCKATLILLLHKFSSSVFCTTLIKDYGQVVG